MPPSNQSLLGRFWGVSDAHLPLLAGVTGLRHVNIVNQHRRFVGLLALVCVECRVDFGLGASVEPAGQLAAAVGRRQDVHAVIARLFAVDILAVDVVAQDVQALRAEQPVDYVRAVRRASDAVYVCAGLRTSSAASAGCEVGAGCEWRRSRAEPSECCPAGSPEVLCRHEKCSKDASCDAMESTLSVFTVSQKPCGPWRSYAVLSGPLAGLGEPREPFADVLFGDGLRGAAVRVHQRVAIGYAVERTLFM